MPAKRAVPHIDFKHFVYASCFGIQPIIVEPDGSVECNLFNLYRNFKPRRRFMRKIVREFTLEESDVKICYHHKTEEEKQQIVKNAINYYQLPLYCLRLMKRHASHARVNMTLDQLIAFGSDSVNSLILRFALRQFASNLVVTGNRFLSSNTKLLDNLRPLPCDVGITEKIVVPEGWMPQNEILVVANGGMTFDNGMLLCPLIYREEFNRWLFDNDKSDDLSWMKFDRYPIMREYRYLMDLYAEYMNECIPLEWHVEVFEENVSKFYTHVRFNA